MAHPHEAYHNLTGYMTHTSVMTRVNHGMVYRLHTFPPHEQVRPLLHRPFLCNGEKSTLLCDSPLCRDGIVVIKFTKSRKLPRHRFYIGCFLDFVGVRTLR